MNNPNNLDKTGDPLSATCHSCSEGNCSGTTGAAGSPNQPPLPDNVRASYFLIEQMDCPTEEQLIRNRLEGMAGIARLDFNLMARKLTVLHTLADTADVISALNAINMSPRELDEKQPRRPEQAGPSVPGKTWWLLGISGVSAVAAEISGWTTGVENSPLIIALALISILAGGLPTLKKGWIALKNLTLNINFLMSVAVIGAVAIGEWPEAAVVSWLFAVAEMIEALSLDRARHAISGLMAATATASTMALRSKPLMWAFPWTPQWTLPRNRQI